MNVNLKKIIILIVSVIFLYLLFINYKNIIASLRFSQLTSVFINFENTLSNQLVIESDTMKNSRNNSYWLNSGAMYHINNDIGSTIQGSLPKYSPWRISYEESNPIDTDQGYHPQNIFRLITRKTEDNLSESFYFLIVNDNLSQSPNRNESNGILLIGRYQNSNNLYYAGIRVDGTAVIKKKKDGVYYTLAQTKIFNGDKYEKNINPNLLPKNMWIGIRTDINNVSSTEVKIDFLIDKNESGTWTKILTALDHGQADTTPILNKGFGGIRSDFMDVKIKDFRLISIF